MLTVYLTFIPTFYLAYILTFYNLTISHIEYTLSVSCRQGLTTGI